MVKIVKMGEMAIPSWGKVCANRSGPVVFAPVRDVAIEDAVCLANAIDADGQWRIPQMWNMEYKEKIEVARRLCL